MKSLETMENPMLHSLLKAYGDAYSAAINLRIPDRPRNDPYFADRAAAPEKARRPGRGWRTLLAALF
jgi:hypothetical protein